MKINIKRLHPDAVIPNYATSGDAGMDLTAISKEYDEYGNVVYGTGLAFEIPEGYYGDLRARSSIAKYDLVLSNGAGTLDSGYRGEVKFKFKRVLSTGNATYRNYVGHDMVRVCSYTRFNEYSIGDRIGQIIITRCEQVEVVETNILSETKRGTGGFGSTGR